MVANSHSDICLVRWCCYMINNIRAQPHHNLFSYTDARGNIVPITYTELTEQMREWIKKSGVKDEYAYSSHSLRRGGSSKAFENGVPDLAIQTLGSWASEAYQRYIDITLEARLKAWLMFSKF